MKSIHPRALLAGLALLLAGGQSHSQTTFWNNLDDAWGNATSWTAGVPTASTLASFDPKSSILTQLNQTVQLTGAGNNALGLALSNSYSLGQGYDFFGGLGSKIIVSGSGIRSRGVGVHYFSGPALEGAAPGNLTFNIGTSTTIRLAIGSTATVNSGNVTVLGGTMDIYNVFDTTPKLTSANVINLTGGGSFNFLTISSPMTLNLGALPAGTNNVSGVNTFKITPVGGGPTIINFDNTGSGFTTRPGTRGVYHFVASGADLGASGDARFTFTGTPFLGANGLLANSAGGGTFGYAIATDNGGTNFATWTAADGIIRATATANVTDAAGLAGLTSTSRGQFNPAASTTITASGAVTSGSLRITPDGPGAVLAMGVNNLVTNALMLDGSDDFSITGTGNLGGTGTRYIHVNNPDTTLSTGIVIANSGNPTVVAGPGFVALTGSSSQNTLTGTNRLVLAGGVLRGNDTQIGFTSSGSGIISFGGGVLEITGGGNGTGTSADFRRVIGAGASNVTWGAGTANEQGGGGFSAFGSAASVNLGGNATADSLQWGQTNFIADGFALKFGSTKSNAVLNWLNPLQLDNGSGYQPREINVTKGVGGDRTVMRGVISGNATADLYKTGDGTLELTAANTYQGNTAVYGGTLIVSNNSSLGNPSAFTVVGGNSPNVTLHFREGVTVANNLWFTSIGFNSRVEAVVGAGAAFRTGTSALLRSDLDGINTSAAFLGGTNTGASPTTLSMRFDKTSSAVNDSSRVSDIFSVTGTNLDIYVLELGAPTITSSDVMLGWLDTNINTWVNAVLGNNGATGGSALLGYNGSFASSGASATAAYLGSWGYDTVGQTVWAILDHNSSFAVIIPEPSSAALLILAGSLLLSHRRCQRRARSSPACTKPGSLRA